MIQRASAAAMFVSSPGGVLLDAVAVADAWVGPVAWTATDAPDTRERLDGRDVDWVQTEPAGRAPRDLLAETRRARRVLVDRDTEWVVSAGTALAVPWFAAAAGLSIPSLWIETLNLHGRQGRAAAICSRLAERVLVQRPDRLLAHRRAVLVGELY
ncbi:MAG: hypothetical protein ACK5RL_09665 [Acidimicrobiales bacterium]